MISVSAACAFWTSIDRITRACREIGGKPGCSGDNLHD
ncbi:hypothetical protein SXCC_00413 [Gluconacetobacter sp. SXCC-1]|nr:hypothetical protein SXCC_00413 [Gluconacetobacter sp. SXCC-1]